MSRAGSPQLISDSSQILAMLRSAGALSPETARTGIELPLLDPRILRELVQLGKVNEPSPGRFYVAAQPRTMGSLAKTLFFWILIVVVPILIVKLSGGR